MAQFQPQDGLSSPPWGEPMIRVATTILSDKVQEHLLFVRYWLYMSHTFCLTPCFFMALIIADGFMLSKAPLMSNRVATTNSLPCRPFPIFFLFIGHKSAENRENYYFDSRMRRIFWHLCHSCSPRGFRDMNSQNHSRTYGTTPWIILLKCAIWAVSYAMHWCIDSINNIHNFNFGGYFR
jgi:hypothetical protein